MYTLPLIQQATCQGYYLVFVFSLSSDTSRNHIQLKIKLQPKSILEAIHTQYTQYTTVYYSIPLYENWYDRDHTCNGPCFLLVLRFCFLLCVPVLHDIFKYDILALMYMIIREAHQIHDFMVLLVTTDALLYFQVLLYDNQRSSSKS